MSVTESTETATGTTRRNRRNRATTAAAPRLPRVSHAGDATDQLDPRSPVAQVPMARRLAARLIDLAFVGTWMFALSVAHIFLHLQLWSGSVNPEPWGTWFLATITFAVLYAAYEIVFVHKAGATPGKDFMNIRVVDADTGELPTWGQSARRWLLPGMVQPIPGPWIGAVLTLCWGATGFLDDQRRTVHDRISGTRVVPRQAPTDPEEIEERRSHFMPRIVDPFEIYRIARRAGRDEPAER
ncbi:MAG: RDD family protein [Acidimicrobiales bacterium]